MFGNKHKTSGSVVVVFFNLILLIKIFLIFKKPQVLAFSKTLKEPVGL
jgi:hypothetical protein